MTEVQTEQRAWQGSLMSGHGDTLRSFAAYLAFCVGAFVVMVFVFYVQSFPGNDPVPWPTFAAFDACFQERTRALADVAWHGGLIAYGYEPSPVVDPYAHQHNWAYFPLNAYAGKLVYLAIPNLWWALQVLTTVSTAAFLTFIRREVRAREPQDGRSRTSWYSCCSCCRFPGRA